MKSKINFFLFASLFCLAFQCDEEPTTPIDINETVTDIDGNIYQTLTIGNQTWMLENLKTTTFNDGSPITQYDPNDDWHNGNSPVPYYQWADTNDLNGVFEEELPFDYYGVIYNHFAIESGKLAPEGWRIPTVEDFEELENFLAENGYQGTEGLSLKSDSGWLASSGNGTNAIGFNGLPNGYVSAFGTPTAAEVICTWITSTLNETEGKRVMVQLFDEDVILYSQNVIQIGAGIRCIKE